MSDKKTALALAMEAEHESEQVADTYQALTTVLDVENQISEAKEAQDVAVGLEALSAVLESIAEQDIHDLSLTQVIGDIAGAATGVSGELFTPAMEDVEADNDSAERASTLTDRIMEILSKLLEKLSSLAKWIYAQFKKLLAGIKNAAGDLRGLVGRKIAAGKARRLQRKITQMNDTARALEEFIPLMAELAEVRIAIAQEPAGYAEETLDLSWLSRMEKVASSMERFSKKYENDRYVGNIKFAIHEERIDRISAQAAVLTFGGNYFTVSRKSNDSEAVDEADDRLEKATVDNALIRDLDDVVRSYSRFLSEHGSLSLPTLIKAVEQKVTDFKFKAKSGGFAFLKGLSSKEIGTTERKVLNMSVMAMTRDVNALAQVSSYVTVDSNTLNGILNSLVNIDEADTVAA